MTVTAREVHLLARRAQQLADELRELAAAAAEQEAQLQQPVREPQQHEPPQVRRPLAAILSIDEVSEATGVAVETLRYWRKVDRGEGPPFFKLGKRLACRSADLQAWLDAKSRAASGA